MNDPFIRKAQSPRTLQRYLARHANLQGKLSPKLSSKKHQQAQYFYQYQDDVVVPGKQKHSAREITRLFTIVGLGGILQRQTLDWNFSPRQSMAAAATMTDENDPNMSPMTPSETEADVDWPVVNQIMGSSSGGSTENLISHRMHDSSPFPFQVRLTKVGRQMRPIAWWLFVKKKLFEINESRQCICKRYLNEDTRFGNCGGLDIPITLNSADFATLQKSPRSDLIGLSVVNQQNGGNRAVLLGTNGPWARGSREQGTV